VNAFDVNKALALLQSFFNRNFFYSNLNHFINLKFKIIMNKIYVSVILVALFAGCQQELSEVEPFVDPIHAKSDKSEKTRTFYSHVVKLGNGNAKTFYTEDGNGKPLEIGIILNERALQNLPGNMLQVELPFHQKAGATTFTHATLEWNPGGHEPDEIYDIPHFDFHFYFGITSEERKQITPLPPDEFDIAPAPMYHPPLYFFTPGRVPEMGAHWVDLLSPEFAGGEFTKTFIYGSYDGKFIFHEPMITLDYLLMQPDETNEIRQPEAFQADGFYPTEYRISYTTNPKQYIISLTGLEYRQGE
jgi:hypothetical protein